MRSLRVLLLCGLLALMGCRETMFANLREQDANEIIAVLRQNHIAAQKVAGTEQYWGIEVAGDDFPRAVSVLRENGLPRAPHATLGELFRKEGLVSTPSEERIRFVFAQQQELENTLSRIDGVIAARVHVVIPQNDPLSEKVRPASASVFLKHRTDVDLTASIPQIKALVASSIEGLAHESVSLSMFPSRGMPAVAAVEAAAAMPAWAAWAAGLGVLALFGVPAVLWSRRRTGSAGQVPSGSRPVLAADAGGLRREAGVRAKAGSA